MKRKWVIGCGLAGFLGVCLCAGLGVLFFKGILGLTQPVVNASEDFLSQLGQGKVAEAYASTAEGFRSQQDEATFTATVKQLGLTDYASVSWNNRQIKNNEGTAEGVVTTKSGSTQSVSLQLILEADKWKVLSVRYGNVELGSKLESPKIPSVEVQEKMALEALLNFNQAVQAKDFTKFYDELSDLWKKQTTPQKLQSIFQSYIDKEINISPIKKVKPQLLLPATVSDKGVLTIAGNYPTQPSKVEFELEYIQENAIWKLMGITINVGDKK